MGWKSTVDIDRETALNLIIKSFISNKSRKEEIIKQVTGRDVSKMSDSELSDFVTECGVGDDMDLPYYGHNFTINKKG